MKSKESQESSFPLKFEFASDRLLPLLLLRETICRDKLFAGVTQVARLFHKETNIKRHATSAAAAVLKSFTFRPDHRTHSVKEMI